MKGPFRDDHYRRYDADTVDMLKRFVKNPAVYHKASPCVGCGRPLTATVTMDEKVRSTVELPAGERGGARGYTICTFCGALMAVNEDMSLRALTVEEQIFVKSSPRMKKLIETAKEISRIRVREESKKN